MDRSRISRALQTLQVCCLPVIGRPEGSCIANPLLCGQLVIVYLKRPF